MAHLMPPKKRRLEDDSTVDLDEDDHEEFTDWRDIDMKQPLQDFLRTRWGARHISFKDPDMTTEIRIRTAKGKQYTLMVELSDLSITIIPEDDNDDATVVELSLQIHEPQNNA